MQQQRENKDAYRKGGTQTAIGTGTGFNKNGGGVLNSNQLQVQRQSSHKNQSQSLSRSRVTSQNRPQAVNANNRQQLPGSGASSAQGNKKGIKALSSVPGHTPTIGPAGSITATPGIYINQKITNLLHQDGPSSGVLAAHQRNYNSHVQRSSNSTKSRFDAYRGAHADGTSGRAPSNVIHEGHVAATTISSAAQNRQDRQGTNRDAAGRGAKQGSLDAQEMTQLQLR